MAYKQPDQNGFYGRFGGRFVPETLMTAVLELEEPIEKVKQILLFKQNWISF